MKILIAGGAGYIGSALVPELIADGYKVDVLDLFWFGNHLPKETGIVHKDIFHIEENDVKGYEVVIFLAGLSNDPMAEFSPAQNFISNAAAPAYLAYVSKKAGVEKFIYAGSCSVYGFTEDKLYDEDSPTISDYPYGISKLQGERAVMQLAGKRFSTITLRQGTVCGYSPRMRLDLVVNTMFKTAIMDKQIVVNNPDIWRPILGINDAIQAYKKAILTDREISGIFNITSGNYKVGEIAGFVKDELKLKLGHSISIKTKNIQDKRNYKVKTDKAKKFLSFEAKSNIKTIVDELYENLDKFKDFENPNYYNIKIFHTLK